MYQLAPKNKSFAELTHHRFLHAACSLICAGCSRVGMTCLPVPSHCIVRKATTPQNPDFPNSFERRGHSSNHLHHQSVKILIATVVNISFLYWVSNSSLHNWGMQFQPRYYEKKPLLTCFSVPRKISNIYSFIESTVQEIND